MIREFWFNLVGHLVGLAPVADHNLVGLGPLIAMVYIYQSLHVMCKALHGAGHTKWTSYCAAYASSAPIGCNLSC